MAHFSATDRWPNLFVGKLIGSPTGGLGFVRRREVRGPGLPHEPGEDLVLSRPCRVPLSSRDGLVPRQLSVDGSYKPEAQASESLAVATPPRSVVDGILGGRR